MATRPNAGELDERRRGEAHVLDADPLALAVRVVAAGEDVRRREPHLGQAEPSVPPRIDVRLGSRPTRRIASSRLATISGCCVERVAHVPVLDPALDLDRAARLGGRRLLGEAAQEGDVLGEPLVLEVADDEAQLDLGGVAVDEHGVDVALASFGRLGREAVLREAAQDLRGELDRVHELALGPAGMDRAAADAHADLRAGERLGLQLARRRAVDGVGGRRAEALDREVDRRRARPPRRG